MSTHDDHLAEAARLLREARRVVVFSGAGISAASGIPTFRDDGGFWERFPPERFACWNGLLRTAISNPGQLAEFVHFVLQPIATATPNAAHTAIAELEQRTNCTVITQNVDGLHQSAGSREVWEVHGSFFEVVTLRGRPIRRLTQADLGRITDRLDRARTGWFRLPRLLWAVRPLLGLSWHGLVRPKIVLFGMGMAQPDWTRAQASARACDVMLVIGTSGNVWPAAELPMIARERGAKIIAVDPLEPGNSHVWLRGKAAEVLPELVRAVGEGGGEGQY